MKHAENVFTSSLLVDINRHNRLKIFGFTKLICLYNSFSEI